MKLRWACLLLLSCTVLTWSQEDEDEEEVYVEDGETDSLEDSGEVKADANVSFQVRGQQGVCSGDGTAECDS